MRACKTSNNPLATLNLKLAGFCFCGVDHYKHLIGLAILKQLSNGYQLLISIPGRHSLGVTLANIPCINLEASRQQLVPECLRGLRCLGIKLH